MEKTLRERVTAKLSAIKKVLAEEQAPEAVALEDAKLIDGTIVRIEPAIEIGATVQVISEDGSLMDAPDGEHELESGDVIKVEGGVIIELIPILVEDAPVVEEEMSEEAPVIAEVPKGLNVEELTNNVMNKLNEAIVAKINNLKFASVKEVASLKAENKVLKESMTELIDIVQKFAGTPTQEPKKKPYNPFADKEPSKFDFSKVRQSLNK
jgi:DNA-directed RNA polymerase subunit F